jgi:hypothetical protein
MTQYAQFELRIEEPDGKVLKPATFYAMFGNSFDGFMNCHSKQRTPRIGRGGIWTLGGEIMRPADTPRDVGPQWNRYLVTLDSAQLATYHTDTWVRADLGSDQVLANLPDIFVKQTFPIISARAKPILEQLFPGGSYFLETKLFDMTNALDPQQIDRPSYIWIPRHSFNYLVGEGPAHKPRIKLPFTYGGVSDHAVWELHHDPAVRAMLRPVPFWVWRVHFGHIVFNAPTFAALKAAKLTGLVENTVTDRLDRKSWENVGHIR